MNTIESVKEFHTTFNHPVVESPAIPTIDRCDFRVSLLSEELEELKVAIAENNLVEVADALCDLQYVLSGAIIEFGLGKIFPMLFNEVHSSNMSKACRDVVEAELTVKHYGDKGVDAYWNRKDITNSKTNHTETMFLVYRTSDNKMLKSINYNPAQLKPIIHDDVFI